MAETGILRVLSWNVHGWRGSDGREDPERVGRILQELRPDIAGLQEVINRKDDLGSSRELERVAGQAGMTAIPGPTILLPNSDYGNALLTRLPVREVRHIDLSFPHREPRSALDVDLAAGGGDMRIIVTHCGLLPEERRFQVRRLIQAIEERSFRILVLMGDLNEWFVFGRPARWMHRHFGFRGGPRTFPSRIPLFALDRIFVAPAYLLQEVRSLRNPQTRQASDHLPLLALIGTKLSV